MSKYRIKQIMPLPEIMTGIIEGDDDNYLIVGVALVEESGFEGEPLMFPIYAERNTYSSGFDFISDPVRVRRRM